MRLTRSSPTCPGRWSAAKSSVGDRRSVSLPLPSRPRPMAIVANETSHVQRLAVRNAGHFVDEAGEVNLILLTQPLQTVGQERKPIEQAPHNLVLGDYLSERL